MRVGIVALQHESNTFSPEPTGFERFEQDHVCTGAAVRAEVAGVHHEVAGFFAGLQAAGMEPVGVFSARALPGGTITTPCLDELTRLLLTALAGAGPLDGLLVAPHGAAVSAGHADADGYWLSLLRAKVGPDLPIICTIDPHANVSAAMVEACQATIAYRTNPHVDQCDRGLEAAALMARVLCDRLQLRQAICSPPMLINIERQCTSEAPCVELYAAAEQVRQTPGARSVSIVLGFPYADVPEMGAAAIVVTEADVDPQPLADELGRRMWARRERLAGRLMDIDTALRSAADGPGPVLLLDMGDNVGGGSPGDSAYIAHALRRHQLGGGLMTLYDPASVRAARAAGAGATCALDLGGATDPRCGGPLHARAEVVGLFSGTFTESQVRHGGMTHFDMGDTAVVRTPEDTTFMLTSRRLFPVSAAQWTAFGIDPSRYRFIVAKGVHAPVAAYREICPRMFRVNTPGVTSADVQTFSYRYRRRPMYPFEAGAAWD